MGSGQLAERTVPHHRAFGGVQGGRYMYPGVHVPSNVYLLEPCESGKAGFCGCQKRNNYFVPREGLLCILEEHGRNGIPSRT